jgi:hypothetical protein
VAYSPQELKAIESAYAGVYDPAINSALAKLDAKQKADSAKTDADLWAQKQVFQTNENIRQWRATTGTTASSDGNFTSTQTNKGASAAGLPIATFDALDPDIKNYFVNTPYGKDPVTGAKTLKTQLFNDLMKEVSAGTISPEDAATEITNSDLPEAVKQYYIEQMPLAPEVKNGFIDNIWNWFTGKQ